MKLYFCTLFNSNYLSRGLVMYESLIKTCSDFNLYVFAFDSDTCDFLRMQNYPGLIVISLNEFEDDRLLEAKKTRTANEYCWTCSSSTILYCIQKFNLDHCTYIDADMYFYSDPSILIDEMKDKSVLIIPHRYSNAYDRSKESGKYCVQFMVFKNDECGLRVLNWWRDACLEWCYNRIEDGKFGDQKYLDDWLERFSCVHEVENPGGGVAPWNLQQYNFKKTNAGISGTEIIGGRKFDVVFFHFHGLKFYANEIVALSGEIYEINDEVRKLFYFPYISFLNEMKKRIGNIISFDSNGATGKSKFGPMNLFMYIKYYMNDLKYSLKNLSGRSLKNRKLHHHFYRTDKFSSL